MPEDKSDKFHEKKSPLHRVANRLHYWSRRQPPESWWGYTALPKQLIRFINTTLFQRPLLTPRLLLSGFYASFALLDPLIRSF
ncbi:hypothetical protein BJX62DRAFT_88652 [Aspergillus germanicus]